LSRSTIGPREPQIAMQHPGSRAGFTCQMQTRLAGDEVENGRMSGPGEVHPGALAEPYVEFRKTAGKGSYGNGNSARRARQLH
jgi:hypothetical protein